MEKSIFVKEDLCYERTSIQIWILHHLLMIFNPILGGREGFLDDSDARPLTIGGFATAFYSGLWAYDGWNNLVNKVLIMWGSIIVKAMQHFFKKLANPASFFVYCRSFQTNIFTIFYNNYMRKNVPRCRDSDPRPSERESLPITTRPGLPPKQMQHLLILF